MKSNVDKMCESADPQSQAGENRESAARQEKTTSEEEDGVALMCVPKIEKGRPVGGPFL